MILYFLLRFSHNLSIKQKNKGFTLLELLIVVLLLGVLAAVALPNLLGQVAKGRQAEAKNNLGTINRAQQAYRLETASFGNLTNLPIELTGTNYDYADIGTFPAVSGAQVANAKPQYIDDIRDYTAAVNQQSNGTFTSIICESNTVNGSITAIAPNYGGASSAPTCGDGSTPIN